MDPPKQYILVAIALLALALITPDGSRSKVGNVAQVRRSMIEWGERPEWQQFVILGAIERRAVELNRLRELPDTPVRTDHSDSGPKDNHDETALNVQAPASADPIDSGELELPVAALPEKPRPSSRRSGSSRTIKTGSKACVTASEHWPVGNRLANKIFPNSRSAIRPGRDRRSIPTITLAIGKPDRDRPQRPTITSIKPDRYRPQTTEA